MLLKRIIMIGIMAAAPAFAEQDEVHVDEREKKPREIKDESKLEMLGIVDNLSQFSAHLGGHVTFVWFSSLIP